MLFATEHSLGSPRSLGFIARDLLSVQTAADHLPLPLYLSRNGNIGRQSLAGRRRFRCRRRFPYVQRAVPFLNSNNTIQHLKIASYSLNRADFHSPSCSRGIAARHLLTASSSSGRLSRPCPPCPVIPPWIVIRPVISIPVSPPPPRIVVAFGYQNWLMQWPLQRLVGIHCCHGFGLLVPQFFRFSANIVNLLLHPSLTVGCAWSRNSRAHVSQTIPRGRDEKAIFTLKRTSQLPLGVERGISVILHACTVLLLNQVQGDTEALA